MASTRTLFESPHSINSPEWLTHAMQAFGGVPTLRPHQLDLLQHTNAGTDVFCISATGTGKTFNMLAPAIAAKARVEKGILLMVVPTKVLVEQQAAAAVKHGLHGLAINQDTVREARLQNRDLFAELRDFDGVRVAVMTPPMLRSAEMHTLLDNRSFVGALRWLAIDEVHLVTEEGVFLEGYRSLVQLRVRLKSHVVWIAMTGTSPPSNTKRQTSLLGFRNGAYVLKRYSVDRPNFKYIPRFFQHASSGNTFLDLSFIVPFNLTSANGIRLTLVYADYIKRGHEIMTFLDTLIPLNIPNRTMLIRTYNSLLPFDERQELLKDLTAGRVRVLVVTDTATYGLDVPNIQRVVVADMPRSPEHAQQIIGRGERQFIGPPEGSNAEIIAFAMPWVKEPDPDSNAAINQKDAERRDKLAPALRRFYNPTPDCCPRAALMEHNGEPFTLRTRCCGPIHDASASDADLAVVTLWAAHFEAQKVVAPAHRLRSDGTYPALTKKMKESLRRMLLAWRLHAWDQLTESLDHPVEYFLPRRILDVIVDRAHVCSSMHNLRLIADGWDYMETSGLALFDYLQDALVGFRQIFQGGEEDEDEDPEDAGRRRLYGTVVDVLKALLRRHSLTVTGKKEILVERLADHYIETTSPFPTHDELRELRNNIPSKASKAQAVLSESTNNPPPSSTQHRKRKRQNSGKENDLLISA